MISGKLFMRRDKTVSMIFMNTKEIVLEAFRLGDPERIPVTIFGGGVWTIYSSGHTFEEMGSNPRGYAELIVSTHRRMRWDIVYCGSGYNNHIPVALGGKIKPRKSAFLYLAPDLQAPIVRSREDLDRLNLDALWSHQVLQNIKTATGTVLKEIGNEVLVGVTCWGPITLAGQLRGVQDMLLNFTTDPAFVKDLQRTCCDLILRYYEPYAEEGLGLASLAEPTASGDIMSKQHFEEFVLPYLRETISGLKAMGLQVFLHICGDTSDRLARMVETGADCFSLDHKVDISQASQELRGKICYAGNVDPVKVMLQGTPDQVRDVVRSMITKVGDSRGYVVAPGCDISGSTPEANIHAFLQTAKEYKSKPAGVVAA